MGYEFDFILLIAWSGRHRISDRLYRWKIILNYSPFFLPMRLRSFLIFHETKNDPFLSIARISFTISNYIQLYPTISHYIPLYPTISHYIPLYPTISHYIPLYPTISHYIPLYPTPLSHSIHYPGTTYIRYAFLHPPAPQKMMT